MISDLIDAGTTLADRYRLISLLGRGGMGEVWRAEHLGLRAPVAVKLMGPSIATNPEALARFNREAQSAANLRSPHVVQILDHGVDQATGTPFIAMELMEGESLAHRLGRLRCLSPADTARVVTHVARALSRAHEAGIVHRDLKPDNVFLVRNEDEEIAKVLDFGIAKASTQSLSGEVATRTGAVMGTPYYMSPEQIGGSKHVDHRTDLWALGVMACECLTGRRPFDADSIGGLVLAVCTQPIVRPSALGPVPAGFDAWFARALERDPAGRFQSARELADTLRQVLTGVATTSDSASRDVMPSASGERPLTVAAQSVGPMSRTGEGAVPLASPSRSALVPLAAVAAVLSLAGAGAFVLLRSGAPPAAADASSSTALPEPGGSRTVSSPAATPAPPPSSAPIAVAPDAPSASATPTAATRPTVAPRRPAPAAKPAATAPAKAKPPADSTSIFERRKG